MKDAKRWKGFTLIELLVVIAIIAILAAILFPIFVSAKESGRRVACLSNLMQLGRGFRMYADDHNSFFPASWTPNSYANWCGQLGTASEGGCRPEKGAIYRYVKSVKLYLCPTDLGRPAGGTWLLLEEQKKFPLSYSMSTKLSYRHSETLQAPWLPNSGGNRRLGKVLLLVHEPRQRIADGDFHPWGWPEDIGVQVGGVHGDGTNVLFCDYHAKAYELKQLKAAFDRGEWDPDKK